MHQQKRLDDTVQKKESIALPTGLSGQLGLVAVGLPSAWMVMAWGVATDTALPATSYVGLSLVLLGLATMSIVVARQICQTRHHSQHKD